jgi:hypothetical protein
VGEAQEKIYYKKKKKKVIIIVPLEWCWFDCIDQIFISIVKADGLPRGKIWGYQQEIPIKV